MKIVNQTTDELALKEGNAQGIIFGIILVIAGVALGVYSHFAIGATLWIALALFVVGLLLILMSSSIEFSVSKSSGQTATYAINNVLRIETRKSWRMEGSNNMGQNTMSMPRQVLISQSVILFKDGQELPLDHQSGGSTMSMGPAVMMGGSGKEVAIANQVATFLGVPFQEIAPPSGGMGMGRGINVGGIQL